MDEVTTLLGDEAIAVVGILSLVIIGLSEIVKKIGLNSKWIPIVNLILGVAGSIACFLQSAGWTYSILAGLVIGLAASGLYSSVKNVIQGITNNQIS